ncbi:MAG: aldehyde dehydrogenase family protein [Deltaproteobacteria bacterium]|nr:aldehyde dehydrogenase family protein [Deltaproteobacteria bacterium]
MPGRAADAFLSRAGRFLIGGEFVGAVSGKSFEVRDPSTGKVVARVAEADSRDVDAAVAAARRAFDGGPWPRMKPAERARMIWRLGDLIDKNAAELAEIEALDNGKPVTTARMVDVAYSAEMFRYMSGWATKLGGRTIPLSAPGDASWKLAPALAAGCTMVLKSAEQTPLSALRLAELIADAGFPPGVVNIVSGFGETAGAALCTHNGVDKVAFTGSTEVGKLIVKAAAGNLKRVSLELGGKSPMVVFPDADMAQVVPGVAGAIFFNQGEVCSAGSRLYAHRRVFDRVVEGVAGIASKIRLGASLDPATEMGPLVSGEQRDRVMGYIEKGRAEGATVVTGGHAPNGAGYFVQPTVLAGTRADMAVVREEIFGPVLCAERFDDDDLDRIAAAANDTSYGLAASIWTRDIGTAHKMASRLRAGSVWINCHNALDAALPFGGFKQSGWGREMGEEVFHSYTEIKAVTAAL